MNPWNTTVANDATNCPQPSAGPLNDICSQLPQLVRSHVDDIIRNRLPPNETYAYQRAMRECDPRIFRTGESDPLHFVRYCKYELLAGAKRLCLYWTYRLELFGPDRAFLPMTLMTPTTPTDNDPALSALNRQDILAVNTGSVCVLPKSQTTGQSCLFLDWRKWLPNLTLANKLRCLYYLTSQILGDNPSTALDTGAALFFIVMVTSREECMNMSFLQHAFAALCHVLPIKIQVHLLSIPNRKRMTMANNILQAGIQLCEDSFRGGQSGNANNDDDENSIIPPIHVHVQTEHNSILKSLLALGLTRQGIPLMLGGQWEYQEFYTWCQQRESLETAWYNYHNNINSNEKWKTTELLRGNSAPPYAYGPREGAAVHLASDVFGRNSEVAVPVGATVSSWSDIAHPSLPARLLSTRMSSMNSSNNTIAINADIAGNNQVSLLPRTFTTTAKAASANTALDDLSTPLPLGAAEAGIAPMLQQSGSLMSSVSSCTVDDTVANKGAVTDEIIVALRNKFSEEDRLAKRRLADVFYSRRKRDRQRDEFQNLKEEYETLISKQQKLKTEHSRLQSLLQQAHQLTASMETPQGL